MINPPEYLIPLFCFLIFSSFILLILLAAAIRIVPETKRLSVFRLGRYIGEKGPGVVILLPFIDRGVPTIASEQVKQAQDLLGITGEALTYIHAAGSVRVSGSAYHATSRQPINAGARVRITRVLLEVEEVL